MSNATRKVTAVLFLCSLLFFAVCSATVTFNTGGELDCTGNVNCNNTDVIITDNQQISIDCTADAACKKTRFVIEEGCTLSDDIDCRAPEGCNEAEFTIYDSILSAERIDCVGGNNLESCKDATINLWGTSKAKVRCGIDSNQHCVGMEIHVRNESRVIIDADSADNLGLTVYLYDQATVRKNGKNFNIMSDSPTMSPTQSPTSMTSEPTKNPTSLTNSPSGTPTMNPTLQTAQPTLSTDSPTLGTSAPSEVTPSPTDVTFAPTIDTHSPTLATSAPSGMTSAPTLITAAPTASPAQVPTAEPSSQTSAPSYHPTRDPVSSAPSGSPTRNPSDSPVVPPTEHPTNSPIPNSDGDSDSEGNTVSEGSSSNGNSNSNNTLIIAVVLSCLAVVLLCVGCSGYYWYKRDQIADSAVPATKKTNPSSVTSLSSELGHSPTMEGHSTHATGDTSNGNSAMKYERSGMVELPAQPQLNLIVSDEDQMDDPTVSVIQNEDDEKAAEYITPGGVSPEMDLDLDDSSDME